MVGKKKVRKASSRTVVARKPSKSSLKRSAKTKKVLKASSRSKSSKKTSGTRNTAKLRTKMQRIPHQSFSGMPHAANTIIPAMESSSGILPPTHPTAQSTIAASTTHQTPLLTDQSSTTLLPSKIEVDMGPHIQDTIHKNTPHFIKMWWFIVLLIILFGILFFALFFLIATKMF